MWVRAHMTHTSLSRSPDFPFLLEETGLLRDRYNRDIKYHQNQILVAKYFTVS